MEPSNKLVQLGAVAGAIAALTLLAALYAAPLDCLPSFVVLIRRCSMMRSAPIAPLCRDRPRHRRYLFAKHGAKAKAVLLSIVQREVKMACSILGEGFDLAGDTAVFLAIKDDAQNPVLRASVSAIIIPAWISFSLSMVVSVVSLLVRGSIAVVQFRRRRHDVSQIGGPVPYLQRLEAKIEDGKRTIKMVGPSAAHRSTGARASHTDARSALVASEHGAHPRAR